MAVKGPTENGLPQVTFFHYLNFFINLKFGDIEMSKKKENYLPQSTAGLVRYYDTGDEVVKIKPEWVIAFGALTGLLVLVLLWIK